jgi:hypothetical protein
VKVVAAPASTSTVGVPLIVSVSPAMSDSKTPTIPSVRFVRMFTVIETPTRRTRRRNSPHVLSAVSAVEPSFSSLPFVASMYHVGW